MVASDLISAPVSIKVSYADLNLSSTAGAKHVVRAHQERRQAGVRLRGFLLTDIRLWRRCVHEAVDDAVGRVNSPLLTAVHTGKSPAVTAMLDK